MIITRMTIRTIARSSWFIYFWLPSCFRLPRRHRQLSRSTRCPTGPVQPAPSSRKTTGSLPAAYPYQSTGPSRYGNHNGPQSQTNAINYNSNNDEPIWGKLEACTQPALFFCFASYKWPICDPEPNDRKPPVVELAGRRNQYYPIKFQLPIQSISG